MQSAHRIALVSRNKSDKVEKKKPLFIKKELIPGTIVVSAVFIVTALFPIAGAFVAVFTPLAVLCFSKSSSIQGVIVFTVSIAVALIVLKPMGADGHLPFMFCWGSVGIFLSEFLKKKYPLDKAILYSVLIFLAMGLFLLMSYSLHVGEDPWALVETYIDRSVREGIEAYSQAGLLAPEQANRVRSQASDIVGTVYHLVPAIAVISTVLFIWLNVISARALFSWRKASFPYAGDLARWKVPDQLVWFVVASGALILIPVDSFKIAGLNLISIFLFVYFFQGLSIIQFYFERKNLSYFLRGVLYVLIFGQQFVMLTVVGLGFFDLWMDFRKLNSGTKLSEEKGETP